MRSPIQTLLSLLARAFIYVYRITPYFRGKHRAARFVDALLGPTCQRGPQGVRLLVLSSSPMDLSYLDGSAFREDVLTRALDVLMPGDTVLDIGANIGFFSFLAGARVGPRGRVFAFEPSLREYKRLLDGILVNRLENVVPVNLALSDAFGDAAFSVAQVHTGINRIAPAENAPLPDGTQPSHVGHVAMATVDSLFSGLSSEVRLVKIDVEGAEMRVLRGMTKLLQDHRPAVVLVEVTDSFLRSYGDDRAALLAFMSGHGYRPTVNAMSWQYDELFVRST